MILLPSGDETLPVRPSELITAKKLLVENGYLEQDDFEPRLAQQFVLPADA